MKFTAQKLLNKIHMFKIEGKDIMFYDRHASEPK